MVADIALRLKNLSKVVDRMSVGSRMILNTDDPEKPAYVTTHFDKDFACVQIVTQAGGSTGVEHNHESASWVFLLEGSAALHSPNLDPITMAPGQFHCIASDEVHSIEAVTDVTYVLITMPSLMLELSHMLYGK